MINLVGSSSRSFSNNDKSFNEDTKFTSTSKRLENLKGNLVNLPSFKQNLFVQIKLFLDFRINMFSFAFTIILLCYRLI